MLAILGAPIDCKLGGFKEVQQSRDFVTMCWKVDAKRGSSEQQRKNQSVKSTRYRYASPRKQPHELLQVRWLLDRDAPERRGVSRNDSIDHRLCNLHIPSRLDDTLDTLF